MNLHKDKIKLLLIGTLSGFGISSLSLVCVSILDCLPRNISAVCGYIIGILFWLGLLVGIVLSGYTTISLRRSVPQIRKKYGTKDWRVGIISIELTPVKLALYGIFIIGFLLVMSDVFFRYIPSIIMFPIIAITILAFEVHCVVDGINYRIYKLLKEGKGNED